MVILGLDGAVVDHDSVMVPMVVIVKWIFIGFFYIILMGYILKYEMTSKVYY